MSVAAYPMIAKSLLPPDLGLEVSVAAGTGSGPATLSRLVVLAQRRSGELLAGHQKQT